MTNEELDAARGKEAEHIFWLSFPKTYRISTIAARLAREGWQPPEPVDPDLLAAREWCAEQWPTTASEYAKGRCDTYPEMRAYLAGCTRGREGAKGLVEALENTSGLLDTPVGRRRHAGDSFYDDVIASSRAALTSAKRGG